MSDEPELKIKGAAARASENESSEPEKPSEKPSNEATPPPASALEDGEVSPNSDKDMKRYRWCKCLCDPAEYGRDHYFLHLDTQESRWDPPDEKYWLWDAAKQTFDDSGLHPKTTATTSEPEEYTGYNPAIHGSYDPKASYAKYHEKKRKEEELAEQGYPPGTDPASIAAAAPNYAAIGTFNRFTGNFQGADKSAERHSDHAKSGRQMNAFFDVNEAANMHDGRSLKEERRNEKLSKKQIKELAEKRRAKKEKKRMDFYKS